MYNMKVALSVLCVSTIMLVSAKGFSPVCQVATSPPSVPMPKFTLKSYKAHITGKITDSQAIAYDTVVYDSVSNVKSSTRMYKNKWTRTIIDWTKNQQYFIQDGTCKTLPYDATHTTNSEDTSSSGDKILNAMEVGGKSTYIGKTTIRGIPVEQWQLCQSMNGDSFTTDVFFNTAATQWSMPGGLPPPVPVRIEIKGLKVADGQPNGVSLHNIYDIVHFEEFKGDKDSEEFQIPRGVNCTQFSDVNQTPPNMGSIVSFVEQLVRPSVLLYRAVFYDTTQQLSKELHIVTQDFAPITTQLPTAIIRDFSSGIAYFLDANTGSCLYRSFNRITDASNSVKNQIYLDHYSTSTGDSYLHMSSVQHMFAMEGQFTYNGLHQVRNVWCRAFTRTVDNYLGVTKNLRITFYFALNSTFSQTLVDTSGGVTNQLVRRVVQTDTSTLTYDYFDYDPNPVHLTNPYDISSCFDDDEKQPFLLTFKGQALSPFDRTDFTSKVTDALAKAIGIAPIRVHWNDVTSKENVVALMGAILDTLPDETSYLKAPGKDRSSRPSGVLSLSPSPRVNVNPELCAAICSNDVSNSRFIPYSLKTMNCSGFSMCGDQCVFYPTLTRNDARPTSQNFLKDSPQCDYYHANTRPKQQKSLQSAWRTLQSKVRGNQLRVKNVGRSSLTFVADSVVDLSGKLDTDAASSTKDYILIEGQGLTSGHSVVAQDLESCAKQCTASSGYRCERFSFCEAGSQVLCTLSADRTGQVAQKDGCNTFTRTYLFDFEKMPGLTALSNSDAVYQGVDGDEGCAKLCQQHEDFLCESFEYCTSDAGGTCLLGKTHYYIIPAADVKMEPSCTHYSRNYLDDFVQTDGGSRQMGKYRQVTGVTVAQCARLCSLTESNKCLGFFYLPDDTTPRCHIADFKGSKVTVDTSSFVHYKRLGSVSYDHYMDKIYAGAESSSNDGYTGGSMGGLAFGAICLGCALAIVGFFVLKMIRRVPAPDIGISFTNKNYEDSDS